MFNVKDLEDAIFAMQGPKLPRGIKVTTEMWHYLETLTPGYAPKYGAHYMGLPIEIDDEINGLYEIVY